MFPFPVVLVHIRLASEIVNYFEWKWEKIYYIIQWVSEWLLFNANSAIFQLYHGKNKLIFNEMMMRPALN
jgi:hypothetical protein